MITAHGKIIENKFIPNLAFKFENDKRKYEGKLVDVVIKESRESAKTRQHGYYRGGIAAWVCKHYLKHITPQRFHKYYQDKFLKFEDEHGTYVKSTSELNTKEYAKFTDNVRMDLRNPDNKWKMSIDTADPDEYLTMKAEGTWEE